MNKIEKNLGARGGITTLGNGFLPVVGSPAPTELIQKNYSIPQRVISDCIV